MKQLIIKETEKQKRGKNYYQNRKEVLKERAKNKYRELSEEDENIKREYGRNRYHPMSEKEKQKIKEYQKNYCKANKKLWFLVNHINFYGFNSLCFRHVLLNP